LTHTDGRTQSRRSHDVYTYARRLSLSICSRPTKTMRQRAVI